MRNHTAIFTRNQECYRFGHVVHILPQHLPGGSVVPCPDAAVPVGTNVGGTGKQQIPPVLPYLYSEFMKAALRQDMLIRPLAFDYPGDEKARHIHDQLMVGESVMIAPGLL